MMSASLDSLPVIVGVGQIVDRWSGPDAADAPHPRDMIAAAIDRAITDTQATAIGEAIDCAAFVRAFPDSLPRRFDPFGRIENLPHAVLSTTSLDPVEVIYSAVGGEQPQALVNELARRLASGDITAAVIAGGEVTGALKSALKQQLQLDWSDDTAGPLDDRASDELLLTAYEIANGLGMPPQTYAAQEQAWRARRDLSITEYRQLVGEVFAGLSQVAADNPYAQFPEARDAEFLATASHDNYPVCDPLLKWHVAQDAVNQAAALILTTAGTARELGVPSDRWVYLHGHADIHDAAVSQRPDLSRSEAIELALDQTLAASGLGAADVAHLDLYSCFPIVPMLAAEHLGIDPTTRSLTVTGGLPFFGGPGNNYSTHAIASMVEVLRNDRESYGLVLANGGFVSKHSAAVYSSRPPTTWEPQTSVDGQRRIDDRAEIELIEHDCIAEIEAYSVAHGRGGPTSAFVIGRAPGGRVIAKVDRDRADLVATLSTTDDVVGRRVRVERRDRLNVAIELYPEDDA